MIIDSTLIALFIAIFVYGTVLLGNNIIDKKIDRSKGSSGPILRAGIFLLILRNGTQCASQIATLLNTRIDIIEKEIQFLINNRKIIKEKSMYKVIAKEIESLKNNRKIINENPEIDQKAYRDQCYAIGVST